MQVNYVNLGVKMPAMDIVSYPGSEFLSDGRRKQATEDMEAFAKTWQKPDLASTSDPATAASRCPFNTYCGSESTQLESPPGDGLSSRRGRKLAERGAALYYVPLGGGENKSAGENKSEGANSWMKPTTTAIGNHSLEVQCWVRQVPFSLPASRAFSRPPPPPLHPHPQRAPSRKAWSTTSAPATPSVRATSTRP